MLHLKLWFSDEELHVHSSVDLISIVDQRSHISFVTYVNIMELMLFKDLIS